MPQLDPAPWFTTLVFTWLIFLAVIPPKVTAHTFPNELAPQSVEDSDAKTWAWTWTW